ncbi:MAG TPA: DUF6175 family protein [Rectinemataceae bacterium]|nr:DUF6175 family protein [Rectinemataceae bacterium]
MLKVLRVAALVAAVFFVVSCASAPQQQAQAPQPQPAAPASSAQAPNAAQARAQAIVQGGADLSQPAPTQAPSSAAPAPASAEAAAAPVSSDQPGPLPNQLTPAEQAYLQNYLSRLNYMVYYDANSKMDPQIAKIAVSQANRYLIEKMGLSVIDFDQIEQNKKDQQAAYQAETGGSIDMIQYLAQKFNADVYVEISLTVNSETRDGKFYASAQGAMKIFDTSTAMLLGSITFQSQPAFSPTSADAAIQNAVAASVWMAMPKLVSQTKALLQNSLSQGIRYEIILQKTPDARQVSQLRRALAKKVREVDQVSYSPNQTVLDIYTFQPKNKIEDEMYAAGNEANMPDLSLVYSRGKSFTFDSGL